MEADDSFQPVVIDMKSSALRVSRVWKTQIALQKMKHPKTGATVKPPLFATQWKISTIEETNDQGSWFNYQVETAGIVKSRDLLLEAKSFRDSVAAGTVKAAPEPEEDSSTPSSGDKKTDDEIPF